MLFRNRVLLLIIFICLRFACLKLFWKSCDKVFSPFSHTCFCLILLRKRDYYFLLSLFSDDLPPLSYSGWTVMSFSPFSHTCFCLTSLRKRDYYLSLFPYGLPVVSYVDELWWYFFLYSHTWFLVLEYHMVGNKVICIVYSFSLFSSPKFSRQCCQVGD